MRSLFTRESVLASDWYAARLDAKQRNDQARSARGVAALEDFLHRPGNDAVTARLGLDAAAARRLAPSLRWCGRKRTGQGSSGRSGCSRLKAESGQSGSAFALLRGSASGVGIARSLVRASMLALVLFTGAPASAQTPPAPTYVAEAACADCHANEQSAHAGSQHARAM